MNKKNFFTWGIESGSTFRWQLPHLIIFMLFWHTWSFPSSIKKIWDWMQWPRIWDPSAATGLLTSPLKSVQCNLNIYYISNIYVLYVLIYYIKNIYVFVHITYICMFYLMCMKAKYLLESTPYLLFKKEILKTDKTLTNVFYLRFEKTKGISFKHLSLHHDKGLWLHLVHFYCHVKVLEGLKIVERND